MSIPIEIGLLSQIGASLTSILKTSKNIESTTRLEKSGVGIDGNSGGDGDNNINYNDKYSP